MGTEAYALNSWMDTTESVVTGEASAAVTYASSFSEHIATHFDGFQSWIYTSLVEETTSSTFSSSWKSTQTTGTVTYTGTEERVDPLFPVSHYGSFTQIPANYAGPISELRTGTSYVTTQTTQSYPFTTVTDFGDGNVTVGLATSYPNNLEINIVSSSFLSSTHISFIETTSASGSFLATYYGDVLITRRSIDVNHSFGDYRNTDILAFGEIGQSYTDTDFSSLSIGTNATGVDNVSAAYFTDDFAGHVGWNVCDTSFYTESAPSVVTWGEAWVMTTKKAPAMVLLGESGNLSYAQFAYETSVSYTNRGFGDRLPRAPLVNISPSDVAIIPEYFEPLTRFPRLEGYTGNYGSANFSGKSMTIYEAITSANSTGTQTFLTETSASYENQYNGAASTWSDARYYGATDPIVLTDSAEVTLSGIWGATSYTFASGSAASSSSSTCNFYSGWSTASYGVSGAMVVLSPVGMVAEVAGNSGWF